MSVRLKRHREEAAVEQQARKRWQEAREAELRREITDQVEKDAQQRIAEGIESGIWARLSEAERQGAQLPMILEILITLRRLLVQVVEERSENRDLAHNQGRQHMGMLAEIQQSHSRMIGQLTELTQNQLAREMAAPAKTRAFENVIDRFYQRYPNQSWKNIISIGDAPHEREALARVVRLAPLFRGKRCRSKSIKFVLRPTIEQLCREMQMLRESLREIVLHDDDIFRTSTFISAPRLWQTRFSREVKLSLHGAWGLQQDKLCMKVSDPSPAAFRGPLSPGDDFETCAGDDQNDDDDDDGDDDEDADDDHDEGDDEDTPCDDDDDDGAADDVAMFISF
ncbi:hypothetical protein AK812_SmicGene37855 [Symbiodinium microadriaticum]|uniref:Uncharacterized protein n=1 Tax=Symbiodinium microadriaticum TaxID=2951 RepID=A0A1Q9CF91_SYMMI|nr:hypothetical protein AK812_SmicGene37855 [Symbiodinium microadriaticum]